MTFEYYIEGEDLIIIKPGTIWITGLSGSGKTSLGTSLKQALQSQGVLKVELLDGDETRKKLPRTYGYSNEDRKVVGVLVGKLAHECNQRGNIAIVCAISHVKQTRAQIREYLSPNFMEVYLDCPVNVCANRDRKGHYRKALAGEYDNFIGVTEPYQVSDHPDLILDTVNQSVAQCTDILLDYALKFFAPDS